MIPATLTAAIALVSGKDELAIELLWSGRNL
jgi:hypothetical protein